MMVLFLKLDNALKCHRYIRRKYVTNVQLQNTTHESLGNRLSTKRGNCFRQAGVHHVEVMNVKW